MLDRLHITAALAAMVAIPVLAADLSIEVRGVRSADGRVYVAVHGPESKDTFPSRDDIVSGLREPARIGTLRFVVTDEEAEFPRVAPAVTGRRNRYVYTLGVSSQGSGLWRLRRVVKRDLEAGTTQSFDYGPGVIAEEHVFVPRCSPTREDDGWLVGAFLDYVRGLTGIAVFDARHVADGPVARAWLEYPLPLAFHGEFSPA